VDELDFEGTLQHLHAWLGQLVSVTVSPASDRAIQAAVLGGTLARTEEPSDALTSLVGVRRGDEVLFFFVERDAGDRRDAFILPKAFFEYAYTQRSSFGHEMLVIVLREVHIAVRLMPEAV
jgi:hypothetical protein